jgi:hypothetical protein
MAQRTGNVEARSWKKRKRWCPEAGIIVVGSDRIGLDKACQLDWIRHANSLEICILPPRCCVLCKVCSDGTKMYVEKILKKYYRMKKW